MLLFCPMVMLVSRVIVIKDISDTAGLLQCGTLSFGSEFGKEQLIVSPNGRGRPFITVWQDIAKACVGNKATCYGLNGPGIESQSGWEFSPPSWPAQGPTQPPIQWAPSLCRGVYRLGWGVDHPPHSSAEVRERVGLYSYSPSEPSWPILGCTLPLCVRCTMYWRYVCHRQCYTVFSGSRCAIINGVESDLSEHRYKSDPLPYRSLTAQRLSERTVLCTWYREGIPSYA
jgi:hypothetical protein